MISLWMKSCQNPPLCSTAEVRKSSKFSSHKENVIWSIVVAKVPPFLSHFCSSFWELGLTAIDRQNLTPPTRRIFLSGFCVRPRSVWLWRSRLDSILGLCLNLKFWACWQYGHSWETWEWQGVERCRLCLRYTSRSAKCHRQAAVGHWVSLCVCSVVGWMIVYQLGISVSYIMEFLAWWVQKSKVFAQKSTVYKWNYCIL